MTSAAAHRVRRTVEQVCAEMDLPEFAANTVEQWVHSSPDTWPTCCLGDCDPCNGVLRTAAKRVLIALEAEAST